MDIPKELQQFKLTAQRDIASVKDWLFKEWWRFASWMPFPLRRFLDFIIPNRVKFNGAADLTKDPAWPAVLNQGGLGACTENAVDVLLEFDEAKEGKATAPSLSRLFMYWVARGGVPVDLGSSLSACLNGVHTNGACIETAWPYDTSQFAVKPPEAAWADAATRKGANYFRLLDLNDMMACLDQGYPFAISFSVFDNFYALNATDCVLTIPTADEQYHGGHTVVIYGYDLKRQVFLAQNSWGKYWANEGRFELTFDLMADSIYVGDCWCIRTIADPA